MAFQITEIVDSQSDNVLIKALHQNNLLTVTVCGIENQEIRVGELIQAEIRFDEIADWKVLSDFEDIQSGIWQEQDGIHLVGRVHSILDYGDGRVVIDVYMQNGPEFFTVNLDAMDETMPDANEGIEITVKNLYITPRS